MTTIINSTMMMRCPHCMNVNKHQLILDSMVGQMQYSCITNEPVYVTSGDSKKKTYLDTEKYTVYKCSTCQRVSVFHKHKDYVGQPEPFGEGYEDKLTKLVYPQVNEYSEEVSETIRRIYTEASVIKKLAPNAFATQIRRALEALCEEQGAPQSKQIFDKLKFLSEQGRFPDGLLEMGHIIRKVSRFGAHPKDEDISAQEAEMLDDIFGLILDYVYITPAKVRALEAKISKKESKKE